MIFKDIKSNLLAFIFVFVSMLVFIYIHYDYFMNINMEVNRPLFFLGALFALNVTYLSYVIIDILEKIFPSKKGVK